MSRVDVFSTFEEVLAQNKVLDALATSGSIYKLMSNGVIIRENLITGQVSEFRLDHVLIEGYFLDLEPFVVLVTDEGVFWEDEQGFRLKHSWNLNVEYALKVEGGLFVVATAIGLELYMLQDKTIKTIVQGVPVEGLKVLDL